MRLFLGSQQDAVQQRIDALLAEGAAGRIRRADPAFWGGDDARRTSVANRLGWLTVPRLMLQRVPEIEAFVSEVHVAGFRDAVLLGMGGSSLAPEVLRQSIAEHTRPDPDRTRLHVLDTTDPATIQRVVGQIDPERTLVFVSSKSGSTIEPNVLFAYFHALVTEQKGEMAGENFVAITDPGTEMQRVAERYRFRRIFTNPADIGGRYSALSYFGLVPAAVAGIDIGRLLERGVAAENATQSPDNDALRLGAVLGELAALGRDKCTFVVAPAISSFGLWAEQLIAESTGKGGCGIIPVDREPLASPRQYGDDRVFVQLRLEADSNGENDAAIGALIAEGFPAVVIDLDDAYDLGREFFFWEYAVAVAGRVLEINPFDEPNVQESKDNTNRVLAEFERSSVLDTALTGDDAVTVTTGDAAHATSISDGIGSLVDALGPDGYFAITAYIEQTELADEVFAEIRHGLVERRGTATTLGYGPRFLHSTGQLHKGGTPSGVFLQVTVADVDDVAISGRPYTFGQLKRAQAIGDFQSLVQHGRPVVRVHLGADLEAGLEALRRAAEAALEHDRVARR